MPQPKNVAQVSSLMQAGTLDPVEEIERTLAAIEAHGDPSIFIRMTKARARTEAEASAKRLREGRSLGLLDGVPVAWKDLFDLKGMTTTAGSTVLAGAPPAERDAVVVERLQAAGMVCLGQTNMSEFAFSGLGLNPHYGTPINPNGRETPRIPGGSSSGAGVAVAAGLVPVAIGTDTGGSVRIPAAFNGIVGYKATAGRYPMAGVFPLSASLDSLGPLVHTVQDAVWVDAALQGLTAPRIRRGTLEGREIVVPETVVLDDCQPDVLRAFEASLSRLEGAGMTIRRMAIPAFAEIFALAASQGALVTAEAFQLHRHRLQGNDHRSMDPRVVARVRLGEAVTLDRYLAIRTARARLIEAVRTQLAGRLTAFPTVAHTAPPLAPLLADDDLFVRTNALTLRNTLIGNFLDGCGVSIPCGVDADGMPIGFLLSGMGGADDDLLSAALSIEPILRGAAL